MKKRIMTTVFLATMTTGVVTNGMTTFHASKGTSGIYVYVNACFSQCTETTDDDFCRNLNLQPGRYVDSVTIRLKEGDYDKSKTSYDGSWVEIKKKNNPFKEAKASWAWTYLPKFK